MLSAFVTDLLILASSSLVKCTTSCSASTYCGCSSWHGDLPRPEQEKTNHSYHKMFSPRTSSLCEQVPSYWTTSTHHAFLDDVDTRNSGANVDADDVDADENQNRYEESKRDTAPGRRNKQSRPRIQRFFQFDCMEEETINKG